MKKLISTILLATMVLSLPACVSVKDNNRGSKHPDRDADETLAYKPEYGEAVVTVETSTKTTTEEILETSNSIEITTPHTMESAYLQVLSQYESNLRMVDNYGQPSCSYVDITGDSTPELVIQYASVIMGTETSGTNFVYADISFITYDPVSGETVEMLHVPNTIENAGGGFNSDVLLLNNGHIIMTLGSAGDPGYIEKWINEYEVSSNSLVLINSLYKGSFLHSVEDYSYEYVYAYNDEEISEEEYNEHLYAYIDSFSSVITRDVWYDYGYYSRDSEVWANAVMDLPDNSMNYDQIVAILGG